MRVTGIALQNIRTHRSFVLKFSHPTTVIIGDNASGKTTIIESLYLLATGESFRAEKIDEIITFNQELGRIKGMIGSDESTEQTELEVLVTRGTVQGKTTSKRLYTVNGVRRRKSDAISHLNAVVFRPEDMRLVEGSPARRRGFLDAPLASLFPEYARSLKTYEQTLRRRNKLLQQVRDREQPRTALHYWNMSLVSHGEVLQKNRRDFLHSFVLNTFPLPFSVEYQPSVISAERLEEYLPREIAAGHTLIGPHKDDFIVQMTMENELRNIALFGSRGQQRMAVLWLKFGEFEFLTKTTEQRPLLLLDDILSELDEDSRKLALSVLADCQSVITTTEKEVVQLLQSHLPDTALSLYTVAKKIAKKSL